MLYLRLRLTKPIRKYMSFRHTFHYYNIILTALNLLSMMDTSVRMTIDIHIHIIGHDHIHIEQVSADLHDQGDLHVRGFPGGPTTRLSVIHPVRD